ncbi:uncharacterized protein LOC142348542 isoform X2 [Convolutriloba macropyga]|uniref:uncharacterized protein LOC142348542 isoform X2 n=1 Tax=Convolutriloba macropyga TaxID=536237 RepID=UPI003F51E96B
MQAQGDNYVKGECYKYDQKGADRYKQHYTQINVARGLLITGICLAVPIIILIILQMCNKVPFFVGGIFAILQFACLLVAAVMMTTGFSGIDKIAVGFNTVSVYIAAILAFFLTIIIFSSKSKCWDRCRGNEMYHDQETGEDETYKAGSDESPYRGSKSTRPSTESSSLVRSGTTKRSTLSSELASQAETEDQMPDVGKSYGSQRGSQSASEMSKSVVGTLSQRSSQVSATSAGSPSTSASAPSKTYVGTTATGSSRQSMAASTRGGQRPETIEEESEVPAGDTEEEVGEKDRGSVSGLEDEEDVDARADDTANDNYVSDYESEEETEGLKEDQYSGDFGSTEEEPAKNEGSGKQKKK